jgi:RimJ/RimL family protein N-acetyltransferase
MIEAAFSLTRAVEIDADVRVENTPSRRVLEKAGLRHVGTGPRDAPARGGMVNCDRLAMSRSEWAARPKAGYANESVK